MTYRITKQNLMKLLEAYYKMLALECGGVDNWEWYGASINDFIYECQVDDENEDFGLADIAEQFLPLWVDSEIKQGVVLEDVLALIPNSDLVGPKPSFLRNQLNTLKTYEVEVEK